MNASTLLEDMLFQFLKGRLSDVEIRDLFSRADILSHVDEETEEEMKTELYNTFIRAINSHRLIDALKNTLADDESESESESDEEED
jgi:hypothetical protein